MSATRTIGRTLTITGEILGAIMQLVLIIIGARLTWFESDPDVEILLQVLWCFIASLYLGATILTLNVIVRLDQPDSHATRLLVAHPIARAVSTLAMFSASLLGVTMAFELITAMALGNGDPLSELTSIWIMLLSWALLNWGFARIYFSRYHSAADPPLKFPGTKQPRIVDFVYFAFTNATTFAVSDVQVRSSRMRWTVVWHTTAAFFFNALIIALVLNLVTSGKLINELLNT